VGSVRAGPGDLHHSAGKSALWRAGIYDQARGCGRLTDPGNSRRLRVCEGSGSSQAGSGHYPAALFLKSGTPLEFRLWRWKHSYGKPRIGAEARPPDSNPH